MRLKSVPDPQASLSHSQVYVLPPDPQQFSVNSKDNIYPGSAGISHSLVKLISDHIRRRLSIISKVNVYPDMQKTSSTSSTACVIFVEAGIYFFGHAIFVASSLWNWHLFLFLGQF